MGNGSAETVPMVIGKYRLLADIGQGGMARVFLAVAHGPSGFSKLVVLKMVQVHLADDPLTVEMFLDEARLAGRLNHPNVVDTLEVVEEAGHTMMVLEYLEGQSLSSILRRARHEKRAFPLRMHLRTVVESLRGLHYAHELRDFDGTPLNLVHRDISPQNIFVTYDGRIKVLDFGIAKAITSSSKTKAGVLKGKFGYMAPEQFTGDLLDRRVDIYGTGVVLWEAATGERLWKGVPEHQVIHRVTQGDIPWPRTLKPHVHPELQRITMRALMLDHEKRYASAQELMDDLETFIQELGTSVTARDVGSFVASMFADVRAQITHTIETQLSRAEQDDDLEPPTIPEVPLLRRGGPFTTGGGGSQEETRNEEVVSGSVRSHVGAIANTIPDRHDAAQGGSGWLWAVLAAILLLAGGFAVVLFVLFFRSPTGDSDPNAVATVEAPTMAEPMASASASTAQPTSPVPGQIEIRIEATPEKANVFLDDVELFTNPSVQRIENDGKVHTVRAEAKGYKTRTIEVPADRDRVVAIALERELLVGVRGAPRTGAKKPPTAPKTTAAPTATSPKPPDKPGARDRIRNLDKSNPWD